jgi:hypothetical protein
MSSPTRPWRGSDHVGTDGDHQQKAPPGRAPSRACSTSLSLPSEAGRMPRPGGMKVLQYEYQSMVNDREAAKKLRLPKKPKPEYDPSTLPRTKEGRQGPPAHINDPTTYYTSDQLLSVDGCICDKVRVVTHEKTGAPARDYRCSNTKEYGDMMNTKKGSGVLQSRTFSHGEVLFPTDASVKREIRDGFSYLEHTSDWEKTIIKSQGQRPVGLPQDQAMQVLRDDFRASMARPGSACRETLRRA